MASDTDTRQIVLLLLAVAVALFVVPTLFMGLGMIGFGGMMSGTWGGHMWDGGTAGGLFPLFGLAMQLLFLLALVGGGYLLYRAVVGDDGQDPAMAELRSAYARGELTDEEYETRREALEGDRRE